MEIREIADKKVWEDFVTAQKPHTFLESWNWGEFNKAMGDKIWRLGIYDGELLGVTLVIKVAAKRGKFLFIPHGPILKKDYELGIKNYELLVEYLKELAKKESCSFLRVGPILPKNSQSEKLFTDLGFRRAPMHMIGAELMWVLDISPDEEKILKGMRKTTRYLVKKAQADGVKIIASNELQHVSIFNNIYRETARRQHFVPFSNDFLQKEFEVFVSDNQIQVFLAEYKGEFLAGAMIIFYGNSAFYHQGASFLNHPKVPAPYLLQWEIIREAKKWGLEFYNFWGISPSFAKASEGKPDNGVKQKHPWDGLSLFKKGFGGFAEELLPAQDLILNKRYWLTYGIEKFRKIRRGF